jgi:N-acetylneuraminic acid mutarotase
MTPATDVRPSPRRGHTATLVGRAMYVFGGYGSNGPLNDMYKYDLGMHLISISHFLYIHEVI